MLGSGVVVVTLTLSISKKALLLKPVNDKVVELDLAETQRVRVIDSSPRASRPPAQGPAAPGAMAVTSDSTASS